jgi:hypothetical protein
LVVFLLLQLGPSDSQESWCGGCWSIIVFASGTTCGCGIA